VYTAVVTATNSTGILTDTTVVIIDEPITGLVASNDSPTLLGQATTLTATISSGSTVTYTWALGDGQSGSGAVISHTYPATGVYTAVVTATNSVSLITVTVPVTITGDGILSISKSGPSLVLPGEPISYTLTVTNSGSLTATNLVVTDTLPAGANYISGGTPVGNVISWTIASLPPLSSTTLPLVVTATQTISNYDYHVTANDDLSASGQEVVETAILDFIADPLMGAVPLTVTFTNLATPAAISGFEWAYGNGFTQTTSAVTHTYQYTQTGVYTISLTATGGGNSRTLTKTNYITLTGVITRDWHSITTTTVLSVAGEHAMAYDSDQEVVVLYGGNTDGWPYEQTTWEFDGTDWQPITTSLSPTARYGAQMAYDGSQVILFGGSDETDTAFNQTWVYTNSDWNQVTISGTIPASRTYHSLAANPISGTVYLFGGNDGETYFNDLWQYENGAWTEVSVSGTVPVSRTLAALTYDSDQNRLLLFGGRSLTGTVLADLWAIDPAAPSPGWTLLDDGGGGGPPGRMAHSLTYDPATGSLVLIGGVIDEGDTLLGDTWYYQSDWTEASPSMALPARAYHQAVYTDNAIILFSDGEVWRYE
jgi:uncharacterized repeat protein (TIGR01451 family)